MGEVQASKELIRISHRLIGGVEFRDVLRMDAAES